MFKTFRTFLVRTFPARTFLVAPIQGGDVMPLARIWTEMGEEFSKGNKKAADEESLWRAISLRGTKCHTKCHE